MNHAKLLDCTLRDGAYLVDKYFGDNTINGIIHGLMKTGIDYIEIGFFQNDGYGEGKTVYRNSVDAKRYVPTDKKGCTFAVLADCSRYSIDNLDDCTGDSIDAVRECFFKTERFNAINNCKRIKEKGYKVFIQPVDILGYTDKELIDFLQLVNEVEPYCLSIVDTFGSMYQEDLHRVFEIIHHNLVSTCRVGFHSHNNMQLSNALSQEFVRMTYGKREVVVDGTLSGMGRGAGNTPTELIAQYMVSQLGYNYNMDALLDVIDNYMDNIRTRCNWGYNTSYFIAGCYSAHVNNIAYLTKKNSIRSKDIRYILNKIGELPRKRYDYNLLEKTYLEYLMSDIDDSVYMDKLGSVLSDKEVLVIAPGSTATTQIDEIKLLIDEKNPIIICINFIHDEISANYIYFSNVRRYNYWKQSDKYSAQQKIIASNIKQRTDDFAELIVSFPKIIKCGWNHIDNSMLMLLRLLDSFDLKGISIAGFDGFNYDNTNATNYATQDLELSHVRDNPKGLNEDIASMFQDYINTRVHQCEISFVTDSRFSYLLEN